MKQSTPFFASLRIWIVLVLICVLGTVIWVLHYFNWRTVDARIVAKLGDMGVFDGKIALDKALNADVICLVPEGTGPNVVLSLNFHKEPRRNVYYDSESYWFIIAVNDDEPEGRVLAVEMATIRMDVKDIIRKWPGLNRLTGDCVCGSDVHLMTRTENGKKLLVLQSINQD